MFAVIVMGVRRFHLKEFLLRKNFTLDEHAGEQSEDFI